MKRASKIILVIGIVIGGLTVNVFASEHIRNYNLQISKEEFLSKQPTVSVTGILQYTRTDDGSFYSIMPEENGDIELNEYGGINLAGHAMTDPSLLDKRVVVSGKLIEDYDDYTMAAYGASYMVEPITATILVDEIKTLDKTD